jgi:rhodanese-related sulfurtransferase
MLKKYLLTLMAWSVLGGVVNTENLAAQTPNINLSTEESFKMIQDKKSDQAFVVLDVRTPEEYRENHIDKSINIDFYATDFQQKINKLDKKKTYLVYCRSGNRSGKAVDMMTKAGFSKVHNMTGGMIKWQNENRPAVK